MTAIKLAISLLLLSSYTFQSIAFRLQPQDPDKTSDEVGPELLSKLEKLVADLERRQPVDGDSKCRDCMIVAEVLRAIGTNRPLEVAIQAATFVACNYYFGGRFEEDLACQESVAVTMSALMVLDALYLKDPLTACRKLNYCPAPTTTRRPPQTTTTIATTATTPHQQNH